MAFFFPCKRIANGGRGKGFHLGLVALGGTIWALDGFGVNSGLDVAPPLSFNQKSESQ